MKRLRITTDARFFLFVTFVSLFSLSSLATAQATDDQSTEEKEPIYVFDEILELTPLGETTLNGGMKAYRERDFQSAAEIWKTLADSGNEQAATYLGVMFNEGTVGAIDNRKARHYLRIGAEAELPTALIEYGVLLRNGTGGPRDVHKGDDFIRRASEKVLELFSSAGDGNPFDMISLSYLYGSTSLLGAEDDKLARHWIERAAELEHPQGQHHLAVSLAMDGDELQAIERLELLAESGYIWSQTYLGWFQSTENFGQLDHTKAAKWFQLAASKNSYVSMVSLANLYKDGEGVDLDVEKAASLYSRAHELEPGQGDAAYKLALLRAVDLDMGFNDPQVTKPLFESALAGYDPAIQIVAIRADVGSTRVPGNETAFFVLKSIADSGVHSAQIELAKIYFEGKATSRRDRQLATSILEKLVDSNGDEDARELLLLMRWNLEEEPLSWIPFWFFAPGDGAIYFLSGLDAFDHQDYGGLLSLVLSLIVWLLILRIISSYY